MLHAIKMNKPMRIVPKLTKAMMIAHHTGAIEMAQAEQGNGEFPDAIALAKEIESAQQIEIEQLEGLLSP